MTYREKLQKEHPECVSEIYVGGCKGCPKGYGYGPEGSSTRETCIAWGKSVADHIELCRQCWAREIPGEEPEALQRFHENAHMTTMTAAFYNTVAAAVEDYGGNAERLYHYLHGACDLVGNVAALMTKEE